MVKNEKTIERDRTELADEWAAAVAELDTARETLAYAEKKEREAWEALQRSRSLSARSED